MNNVSDNDPLVSGVLARINNEKILPHSRLYFLLREYGIWILWLLTILIGAIAVAVAIFTLVYRYFDLHEVIRETFWSYSLEILPYLWLATIFLMMAVAVFNIRHTSHGYRYPLWILIVSSLVGSLGGGLVLYVVGFGFLIDSELGTYVDSYDSQDKVERLLWQEPEDGRLLGDLVMSAKEDNELQTELDFMDSNDFLWRLHTEELPTQGLELLQTGKPVRLLGTVLSTEPAVFLVCGVLPARARRDYQMSELINERKAWEERMLAKHRVEISGSEGLCSKAIFMRRMNMILPQ